MRHRLLKDDDSGLTLVELIVYVVIAGIFGSLLSVIFITSVQVDSQTRDRDRATAGAQVLTTHVMGSVRNASAVRLSGAVLQARVATGTADWECRSWTLFGGDLVYASFSPGASAPASISQWKTLVRNVTGTQSGQAFAATGSRVTIGAVVTAGAAKVPVTGAAVARARQEGTVTPCW